MASSEMVQIGTSAAEIQVIGRADGSVRPIAVPTGVTKGVFYKVVSAYDALFRAGGMRPDVRDVQRVLPKVSNKTISAVLLTSEFADAMELRGVGFAAENGLSPQQAAVLNVLENFSDGRSVTAKLRDAGVSRTQFNGWMKDPLFRDLYEKRIESHLKDAHLGALSTLISASENGDTRAAEKVLEINGRYSPQNAELQNARAVIQAMVESIQRHVKDDDVVEKIIADVSLAQQVSRITQ